MHTCAHVQSYNEDMEDATILTDDEGSEPTTRVSAASGRPGLAGARGRGRKRGGRSRGRGRGRSRGRGRTDSASSPPWPSGAKWPAVKEEPQEGLQGARPCKPL